MDALLSASDYQDATGSTVPASILTMASGVVRSYCGWNISAETVTATLDSDGGLVAFLPSLYVTAVASVVLTGPDDPALLATDWGWRTDGRLTRLATCGWPVGGQRITVTYSSGYSDIPDAVQGVVMALAERLVQSSAIQSQLANVGGIQTNTTYSQAVTSGAGLTDMEKYVLGRYCLPVVS